MDSKLKSLSTRLNQITELLDQITERLDQIAEPLLTLSRNQRIPQHSADVPQRSSNRRTQYTPHIAQHTAVVCRLHDVDVFGIDIGLGRIHRAGGIKSHRLAEKQMGKGDDRYVPRHH